MRYAWSFQEVDAKLKHIMVGIFHNAYNASLECGAPGDLVVGANIAGFRKVADAMVAQGIISGGMIPKMECCVDAIAGGVERVHILDGRIPHSILIELLSDEGIGTMLKKED